MKPITSFALPLLARLALIGLLVPAVLAHGDEPEKMDMGMDMGATNGPAEAPADTEYKPTYFALNEHTASIYGHIALMVISWVFVLPVGKASRTLTPLEPVIRS
jgi:hypothetical protein